VKRNPETVTKLRHLLVLAGLALLTGAPALAAVRYEQGKAWDARKTRVLYTESHWTRFAGSVPLDRTVLYRCADGTPFARKEIRYSPSALAPAFAFRDVRHDYQEGLLWQDGKASLWHSEDGIRKSKLLPAAPNLVADAGFDEFIRSRWSALAGKERQNLNFVLPSRLDSYTFSLKQGGKQLYRDEPALAFNLGLAGLLGLVVPDIEVWYSKDSRRLLKFKGISNIRDDAGAGQIDAVIEFPLQDAVVPSAEKTQAQSLVLKSCRVG
jgi:hypothetical protein